MSFKPNTDDLREAPSLTLINELEKENVKLKLYDPIAIENAKKILKDLKNITFCKNTKETYKDADAIVLLTEWQEFKKIDFDFIKKDMKNNAIFDGRNQYCPKKLSKVGFDYYGIGIQELVKIKK